MHLVLWEFVSFVNMVFKDQIEWLKRDKLIKVMVGFKSFCGQLSIHGPNIVTYIHIQKPQGALLGYYFSFKSKGYSMQLQTIIDCL
jgi:hypothetical protein